MKRLGHGVLCGWWRSRPPIECVLSVLLVTCIGLLLWSGKGPDSKGIGLEWASALLVGKELGVFPSLLCGGMHACEEGLYI